jgi:transposase
MHKLSTSTVDQVLSLLDKGFSHPAIHSQTGVSLGSISNIRSKYCPDLPRAQGGCPSKLSPSTRHHAIRLVTNGKGSTAAQAAKVLSQALEEPIASHTVSHALRREGLKAVRKKKRPALKPQHKKARMHFAEHHLHWTVDDWKRVIFSDETKINRLGSDGIKWAWKKPGEGLSEHLVEPTVKFGGGSLMMWGCMLWEGVGYATRIEGNMDGKLYASILEDELQQTMEYYKKTPEDVIFQQDNDSKHTSKDARNWFEDHNLKVLIWPANSPDINPIEHLWNYLKQRLGEYPNPPNGILELWERVETEWEKIPVEMCQRLISSMPDRIRAVYKAKGTWTKY